MTVSLISEDRDLFTLCREILADLPDQSWNISAASPENSSTGDVCLWDLPSGANFPHEIKDFSRHLFLIERADLTRLRAQIPTLEAKVLLKPVTRATLEVFLLQAVAAYHDRELATHSLRADRDEILQCLIQTNLRLQEYDQDRTTFLARAVHDFRAPLTALSGYCGLLLSEPLGPLSESQREVLRRMQHSAKRLTRMATAMFELSVGRHVKRQPELKPGDLRECLEQALHEISQFADDKGIAIRTDFQPCEAPIYFEAGQIEQVLINILDNACKFTPKAGTIDVRGYPFFWERRLSSSSIPPSSERRRRHVPEPNSYRVDILDSGTPIPKEHLERIFEEYTSYAGGRDRSGGGLGLAISQMIILQHEGRVWAENTASGPMFSFVLPLHRHEAAVATEAVEITAY